MRRPIPASCGRRFFTDEGTLVVSARDADDAGDAARPAHSDAARLAHSDRPEGSA